MTDGSRGVRPLTLDFPGLTQALLHWADRQPDAPAIILLANGENETARISYAELASSAVGLASAFIEQGLVGQRLLLPAQTSLEFARGFYAALFAGVIAVPVSTQSRGPAAERLRAIVSSCDAHAVLDTPGADALLEVLPDARRIPMSEHAGARTPDELAGDRVALLQYTSGSTAVPRGVAISSDNLTNNAEMTQRAYGVDPGSRVLSWLPLFHDMGLISLITPLWSGVSVVMMPPISFLQKPQRWPIAIDRFHAKVSGGPNFAYEACATRAEPAIAAGIDLSHWKVAFCGSEPVRRATLKRFSEAYAPAGFNPRALLPCYGMAEATVFVTAGHWDPDAPEGPVNCGRAGDGSKFRIVAEEGRGGPAPDGEQGEVWVHGPQVGLGYWNDSEATEATFRGQLPDSPGEYYLRTGDIGTAQDGELYVLGRMKDIIIHRGSNIHAADIEATAAGSHPALADAPSAAFAIEHEDREEVVVVHEVSRRFARGGDDLAPLMTAVEDALALGYALRPHELLLVRPGTLPRTASGKVRRAEVRRAYLAGEFERRKLATTGASA